jgi:hypothetical protein
LASARCPPFAAFGNDLGSETAVFSVAEGSFQQLLKYHYFAASSVTLVTHGAKLHSESFVTTETIRNTTGETYTRQVSSTLPPSGRYPIRISAEIGYPEGLMIILSPFRKIPTQYVK